MQDAARAACVSHAFKRSWRCYPNLAFNTKALGVDERSCGKDEIVRNFTSKVDNILNNHSCIAIKTLEIVFRYYDDKVCNLDSWLQTAITPGIEKLTVQLSTKSRKHYNFPCSLLASENGKLIQYLKLSCCAFSPTVGLCLKSLSRLELLNVNITGDQLGSLLHNAVALQRMKLNGCDYIICLKIPFHLQQLKYLEVFHCSSLRVIEIEAPNFSNFQFRGLRQVQLSLGVALQFKKFDMSFPGVVSYTCANLLSNLRYVEALSLCSWHEIIDTPVLPIKFLHLKHLSVDLNAMIFSPTYDVLLFSNILV
uniref:At1g61320/AtMIF1 LRR domain-containing protein n=1 Tax=Hordeum vulgare subsp. vulgare TaxID=112509 RepID=A0A8I6XZZ4_HORVV